MNPQRAAREKRRCLARVVGWGIANDAAHITAPARDGCGLTRAIQQALAMARLAPEAIAAVSAHGTGTLYNDAMEMAALGRIFPGRTLPVNSVKGAIGHTLGAAGGVEIALGVLCLREQRLPPTVGMRHPSPEAEGWVRNHPTGFAGDYLLSINSGFGGINAAVILKKGDEV
jgi:3-oxoacyl-[acyl-carrier-protein] synthase II